MRLEKTAACFCVLFAALLLWSPAGAQERMPILQPFRTYTVGDQSLTPPPGTRDSAAKSEKWNPRERRHRDWDGSEEELYYPAQLVCVLSGALEPKAWKVGFYFAFEEQLAMRYELGSFSFYGRSDSLFWHPKMGWGSENMNQDFLPFLVRHDYENVQEPAYEFVWQHPTNVPFNGDSIYLNYMFKIPKQGRSMGVGDLRAERMFPLDRGFSADGPRVSEGRVLVWDNGVYSYDSNFGSKEPVGNLDRGLPQDLKPTCFACDFSMTTAVFSRADVTVAAYDMGGEAKWSVPGRGPVAILGSIAYSILPDYSGIQASRLSDGKTQTLCSLPRGLPRTPNSFVAAKLAGRKFLALVVPSQSKMLFFEII